LLALYASQPDFRQMVACERDGVNGGEEGNWHDWLT
jgi:hypothetical protein